MILLLFCLLLACEGYINVPHPEHYYTSKNVHHKRTVGGCTITDWEGTDVYGFIGYPWMTHIECTGGSYTTKGVNTHGELNVINIDGTVTITANNDHNTLDLMGEKAWIQIGRQVSITVTKSAYIYGANSTLSQTAKPAKNDTTYIGAFSRFYKIDSGVLSPGNVALWYWGHVSQTDPASTVVIDCTPGAAVIGKHYHPRSALYMPLFGTATFVAPTHNETIGIGFPRWVSARLRYYEVFHSSPASTSFTTLVNQLRLADCQQGAGVAVGYFDLTTVGGNANFDEDPPEVDLVQFGRAVAQVIQP